MAGSLAPCIACGATSKYKCPECYDPTCSLACSKTHRQTHLTNPAHSSLSPSTSVETLPHPSADRLKTNTYVPLSSYDENQFLHDYHFLSSIGRKVSEVGSVLLSQGMLPQQVQANLSALQTENSHHNGDKPIGPQFRPNFEMVKRLRHREALKEEIKRRRCKIMWLPEGMGREKENRSRWDERNKKVKFSLEVVYRSSASSPMIADAAADQGLQTKRKLFHDLPSMLPLQVKLMSDWERESWKHASKEWKEEQEVKQRSADQEASSEDLTVNRNIRAAASPSSQRGRKRKRGRGAAHSESNPHIVLPSTGILDKDQVKEVPSGEHGQPGMPQPHHTKTFYISDYALSQYGLIPPIEAEPKDRSEAALENSKIPRPYTALPPSIVVAVQVYEVRLRNESSAKYLEWWARKGKDIEDGGGKEDGGDEPGAKQWEGSFADEPTGGSRPLMPSKRGQTQDDGWPQRRPFPGSQELPRPTQNFDSTASAGPSSQQVPPTGPRSQGASQVVTDASHQTVDSLQTPVVFPASAAVPIPLLSRSLLSNLSARLGATRPAPTAPSLQDAPAASTSTSTILALNACLPSASRVDTTSEDAAASPPKARARSLFYPLPTKRFIGLEALLRSIPKDHAVVEFPRVEVWNREKFMEAEKMGRLDIVRHEGQEEEKEEEEEEKEEEESEVSKEQSTEDKAEQGPSIVVPSSVKGGTAPGKDGGKASAPAARQILSLVGYDSDSDLEGAVDDGNNEATSTPATTYGSAVSVPANEVACTKILRSHPEAEEKVFAEQIEESDDEVDEEVGEDEDIGMGVQSAGLGGLADVARRLGMVPATTAATPMTVTRSEDTSPNFHHVASGKTPASAKVELEGGAYDEEEVDWDMV